MTPLFDIDLLPPSSERLEDGAVLLRGFATAEAPALVEEVARIAQAAPFRHLVTPGGYTMSVAMTNCAAPVGYLIALVTATTAQILIRERPGLRCPKRS